MQKKMEEALKNLSPEQRKQLEELMKGGGGGPPTGK
jgi:Spy/CpxP family protein refolding chaperone